jgi:hypothetical protein
MSVVDYKKWGFSLGMTGGKRKDGAVLRLYSLGTAYESKRLW